MWEAKHPFSNLSHLPFLLCLHITQQQPACCWCRRLWGDPACSGPCQSLVSLPVSSSDFRGKDQRVLWFWLCLYSSGSAFQSQHPHLCGPRWEVRGGARCPVLPSPRRHPSLSCPVLAHLTRCGSPPPAFGRREVARALGRLHAHGFLSLADMLLRGGGFLMPPVWKGVWKPGLWGQLFFCKTLNVAFVPWDCWSTKSTCLRNYYLVFQLLHITCSILLLCSVFCCCKAPTFSCNNKSDINSMGSGCLSVCCCVCRAWSTRQ